MRNGGDRNRTLETALRAARRRITGQRRIVLDVIETARDHPNVGEILERAIKIDPAISLATVYRTMSLLEGCGIIQRHSFDDHGARFEKADVPHHDHLIDLRTGAVIEFQSDEIERLQAKIASELGYDLVRHRLQLLGVPKRRPKSKSRSSNAP